MAQRKRMLISKSEMENLIDFEQECTTYTYEEYYNAMDYQYYQDFPDDFSDQEGC